MGVGSVASLLGLLAMDTATTQCKLQHVDAVDVPSLYIYAPVHSLDLLFSSGHALAVVMSPSLVPLMCA